MTDLAPQHASLAAAFSRTADAYDQFADDHPHLTRMRHKVYAHLMRFVPTESRILELNCGTGTDAAYLAQQGYHVHATDISPGMLARLEAKIAQYQLGDRLTMQACSFLELDKVEGGPYDAVFSDLGGLNCASTLTPVIEKLPHVLRPGGIVTWVIMPPICLWELALMFTGDLRLAFRRLSSQGTIAHLEGLYFPVYYFTPRTVRAAFGSAFELLAIEGLSVITPTAESKNLAKRYPALYKSLTWLDDHLAPRWPFRAWGDFFMITLRYTP